MIDGAGEVKDKTKVRRTLRTDELWGGHTAAKPKPGLLLTAEGFAYSSYSCGRQNKTCIALQDRVVSWSYCCIYSRVPRLFAPQGDMD